MDSKVFDVSKPGRTAPTQTSRPIVVGHRPMGVDTVVNETPIPGPQAPSDNGSTPIHVAMADEDPVKVTTASSQATKPFEFDPASLTSSADSPQPPEAAQSFSEPPAGATIPPNELEKEPEPSTENAPAGNFTPLTTLIPNADSKEDTGEYGAHHVDNLPKNHDGDAGWQEAPPLPISKGAGPKRRLGKILSFILLFIIILLVAGYLAIDAGLVKADVNLPFHIFNKQKTSTATVTPPTAKNTAPVSQPPAQSAVPTGFTKYSVADTNVSFAYPTTWGLPTVKKDPGFSKRDGTNKADGVHAYLVDFAKNKDVQIALTSSQYLPAALPGGANAWYYYDYLAWCTGTNDGKIYQQTLHFTTSNKIDTPSTVTCDQGPLATATKLDDSTIAQLKFNINGAPQSQSFQQVDLYTKNLTSSKNLPVLRVKDGMMKNSDDIKKLLATVKVDTASQSSTSTTP
jgi:hypothetical protein